MDTTTIAQIIYYVGIDISKAKLDCWLRPAGTHLCCGNDSDGFDRLDQWLSAQGCSPGDTIICTEDTGLYGKRLLLALTQAGWSVAVEKTTILDHVGPPTIAKTTSLTPVCWPSMPTGSATSYGRWSLLRKLSSG